MVVTRDLASAVWAGDLPGVEAILASGAEVNSVPEEGRPPPIHLAIEQQWVAIVQRLIEAGAEINRDIGNGWTPLVHAIDIESDAAWQQFHEPGHATTELTELLLKAGAIPTERAFQIATEYRNEKALALLHRFAAQPKSDLAQPRSV